MQLTTVAQPGLDSFSNYRILAGEHYKQTGNLEITIVNDFVQQIIIIFGIIQRSNSNNNRKIIIIINK